ncbi:hypothetical protein GCM10025868_29770 [Angustibacter aerolatus]|uniref:Uncharacterized protein n=1 Tax=Angustibacter aerolatus TaxID=1162965 RepID=A0ABQ6JIY5_9ACTN|nr:hypothetical protein GCM10025868_29770 [Angustibacter aerolatus]
MRDVDPDRVLIVTYDAQGRITRLDTDPRCPAAKPTPSPPTATPTAPAVTTTAPATP